MFFLFFIYVLPLCLVNKVEYIYNHSGAMISTPAFLVAPWASVPSSGLCEVSV